MFMQVGKIKIVGQENLQMPGTFIYCANHTCMLDPPMIYSILRRNKIVRYMTAKEQVRGFGGLVAAIAGGAGCFVVDRSKGKTVIEPSVQVLMQREHLVIFPEGKISVDGSCQTFKHGPAIIATEAQKRVGPQDRIAIVPLRIKYNRRHNATAKAFYHKLWFKWRGGATMTIGEPIYVDELQGFSVEEITATVKQFICRRMKADGTEAGCTECG